jgi:hypothetical protein
MNRFRLNVNAWMWLPLLVVNAGCDRKNASSLQDKSGALVANPITGASAEAPAGPQALAEPTDAALNAAQAFFDVLRRKGTAADATVLGLPFVLRDAKGEVCPSKGGVARAQEEVTPLLDCVRTSEFFVRALANNPNPVFDTGATATSLITSVAPDGPRVPPGAVPVVVTLPNNDSAIFLVLLVAGSKVAEVRVVMTFEPN